MSYEAVNNQDRTQSKPSVRTVKMSSTLAFEFLKKASSVALTRRCLEFKQIICLMLLMLMEFIPEQSYLKESFQ